MRRPPVTDAVIAAAPSGEIVFWGRAAQQTFGYAATDMIGKPLSTIVRLPRLRSGGTFRVDATRKGGATFRAGVVVEPLDAMMSIVIRDESRWNLLTDFVDIVSQHPTFDASAPDVAELIGRTLAFDAVAIWNTEALRPQRTVWWSGRGTPVRESGLVDRAHGSGESVISGEAMLFPIGVAAVLEVFGGEHDQAIIDELTRIAEVAARFVRRPPFASAYELSNSGVIEGAHASDSLYRILGLEPQSRPLTLRTFYRQVVKEDRPRLRDAMRKGGAIDMTVRIRNDGETRVLHIQGRSRERIACITDVTNEQREMRRLSGMAQLAATMAHEFKNVLMGIGTFAEVLRRRTAGEVHVQNAVARIQQSLGRGRRITDEVLRFTREPEPVMSTIDVRRWLDDFLPEAEALTGDRAELAVEGDLFIRGDVALLNQALANLMINAREASEKGAIRIEARAMRDGRVDLIVADRGSGMPLHVLERIFQPLFTTKKSGSGLGLAVVQQVVTAHGGTIEVESEVGRGTEFHLRFPGVTARIEPPDSGPISRVLLVEDDPAVTLALCAVLESEGIDVRTATSGAAAISAIARQVPQVVLLDIGLPDVSGAEVYSDIANRWPHLPVVFITAELDDTAVARFLRRPHIGFLRKPFEAEQLLEILSRITAPGRSKSGRIPDSERVSGSKRSK